MSLQDYGWNRFFSDCFESLNDPSLLPGRVVMAHGAGCRVLTQDGELRAETAGKLLHDASSAAELPAVGDWVALRCHDGTAGRIVSVLERRTRLSRKVAGGRTDEQVVAANVDLVLVVMGLDRDFNLRRAERMLTAVWEGGARPAVVLTKRDLTDSPGDYRAEIERIAPGVASLAVNGLSGEGVEVVRALIRPPETVALVGSSGAGKSTLINRLLGESVQRTHAVRGSDGRGRHTTTHRELFLLPGGGSVIDNPGIRELQLWSDVAALDRTFDDVSDLARGCRFRDCSHDAEPGCAVLDAVAAGRLEHSRLESYRRLQRELDYLRLRQDQSAQQIQKQRWRAIHRELRRNKKK